MIKNRRMWLILGSVFFIIAILAWIVFCSKDDTKTESSNNRESVQEDFFESDEEGMPASHDVNDPDTKGDKESVGNEGVGDDDEELGDNDELGGDEELRGNEDVESNEDVGGNEEEPPSGEETIDGEEWSGFY